MEHTMELAMNSGLMDSISSGPIPPTHPERIANVIQSFNSRFDGIDSQATFQPQCQSYVPTSHGQYSSKYGMAAGPSTSQISNTQQSFQDIYPGQVGNSHYRGAPSISFRPATFHESDVYPSPFGPSSLAHPSPMGMLYPSPTNTYPTQQAWSLNGPVSSQNSPSIGAYDDFTQNWPEDMSPSDMYEQHTNQDSNSMIFSSASELPDLKRMSLNSNNLPVNTAPIRQSPATPATNYIDPTVSSSGGHDMPEASQFPGTIQQQAFDIDIDWELGKYSFDHTHLQEDLENDEFTQS
jgi:hypothetical protein